MGYRSHGAMWLSEAAMEYLKTVEYVVSPTAFSAHCELYEDLESFDEPYETDWFGTKGWVYSFSDFKWYDGYERVDAWNGFFDYCEDTGLAFDFVRIGENEDDMEIWTGLYFYLVRSWEVYPQLDEGMMKDWTFSADEARANGGIE